MALKIDIVLPSGGHSWNIGQGWADALQRMGMLGRVFHLARDSEAMVLEQATKEEADLTILMGGDHHLEYLHDTPQKRDAWNRSRVPRVTFCFESIFDSNFPRALEKSGSATEAFTHFVYCDEKDAPFFESKKVPSLWLPQCVDHRRFCPGVGARKPQVFFRGQTDVVTMHYNLRAQLIEKLRQCSAFAPVGDMMSDEDLMQAYADNACAINLPGNFYGYNVRTFEALAAGAVLFQHRVPNRPKNEALFNERQFITYAADQPEALIKKMTEVTQNLGDYREMAERGREACLAAHTIDHRIREIVDFVDRTYRSASRLHIGCGKNILPNYVNIDAIPHDRRLLVQDAAYLKDVTDGQYESIYACHVLEHFPYAQVQEVICTWAKKLSPGGKLYLSVHDVRFLTFAYLLGAPLGRIMPSLFGGQEYPTNFHYVGFDRKTLTAFLLNAGFGRVGLFEPGKLPFTRWDCSGWPQSLNLVAQKAPLDVHPKGKMHYTWRQIRVIMKRYGKGLRRFIRNES